MIKNVLFLGAVMFFVSQAGAKPLQFVLNCEIDKDVKIPKSIKEYAVKKIASQSLDKSWKNSYVLQVTYKSGTKEDFNFKSAQSGDEDYNEYNLDATEEQIKAVNVSGGAIQNRFEWASLTNANGRSFARCSK